MSAEQGRPVVKRTKARFVVVRTEEGYHPRLIAANGHTVYTAAPFTERRGAVGAIATAARAVGGSVPVDVQLVDERTR